MNFFTNLRKVCVSIEKDNLRYDRYLDSVLEVGARNRGVEFGAIEQSVDFEVGLRRRGERVLLARSQAVLNRRTARLLFVRSLLNFFVNSCPIYVTV